MPRYRGGMSAREDAAADGAELESLDLRPLMRAAHEADQAMARRLGLGVTDVQALDHLLAAPMGPGELGARLGLRPASATALVDRLEAAGHVERRRHPKDRRRQVIVPTDHATREAFGALAPLLRAMQSASQELTPAQRRATARWLERVQQALADHAES